MIAFLTLLLAIFFTLLAGVSTFIIVLGNGMSDAPSESFSGGWAIVAFWILAIGTWVIWWGAK